jgi:hypothetical protein
MECKMDTTYRSTMGRGHCLLDGPNEVAELKKHADHYHHLLDKLTSVVLANDTVKVSRLIHACLSSYSGKMSAAVRTIKHDRKTKGPVPIAKIKERAASVNPFEVIDEPVTVLFKPKDDGSLRSVINFGWKRRLEQTVGDDIHKILLPPYAFDYMQKGNGGADGAALRIKELIEGGKNDYLVTVDIKNCFESLSKEGVVKTLPLPPSVTRNVLLIEDDVELIVELPTGWGKFAALSPMEIDAFLFETDTTTRQGLPPGSMASNTVMSRAVLGPLLNATPFADRLLLHGDDIAVTAETEEEAGHILKCLSGLLAASQVGSLNVGRYKIYNSKQYVEFLKYRINPVPLRYGGGHRFTPSWLSYQRFPKRVARKYLEKPTGGDGRVNRYRKAWPTAFPLWESNEDSRRRLWHTADDAVFAAKHSKKTQA